MEDSPLDDLAELGTCTALELPLGDNEAGWAAGGENPRGNLPVEEDTDDGTAAMAFATDRKWLPGRTLRIGFLDGDRRVHSKVIEYARQWTEYANLKFNFLGELDGNTEAEIRISFKKPGNWSRIGTDNLTKMNLSKPTMNLGLTPSSNEKTFSRKVLHEFGHALGVLHEQQTPDGGIPWDIPKVYGYYARTEGWGQDETNHNVPGSHDKDTTSYTSFDKDSIMLYPIPNELTIGDFSVGWNLGLSATDKKYIATIYPPAPPPVDELHAAIPHSGSIGQPLEEDHYHFNLERAARATLETGGDTNVVMALLGPDDWTKLVAIDDDSGQARNAKIERELKRGDYYVRIRHFSDKGQGGYELLLTVPRRRSWFGRLFGRG